MNPFGKYISDYKIYSFKESIEDKFSAEFEGIPGIIKAKELREKSIIIMTRKTFTTHLDIRNHFNNVEDYLEVINDPDLILYDEKTAFGNKIQIISKTYDGNRIAVVFIFTDPMSQVHSIASGFTLSIKKFESYLNIYQIIWNKND